VLELLPVKVVLPVRFNVEFKLLMAPPLATDVLVLKAETLLRSSRTPAPLFSMAPP
jgi:hypothetical protein